VSYPRIVVTERLDLRPMTSDDLALLFPIFSDPAGWWFDPDSRHWDIDTTRGFIERAAARWDRDGLSYWTVRCRDGGDVIGLGGAQRHSSGSWNLNYRLATSAWGHGYATELGRAAIAAAFDADPDVPLIAWVAEHNEPSRRVAKRLGLTNYGPRTDGNDGQVRLAYADRPLGLALRQHQPPINSRRW
jgi:RimJ/RimL family protein N-acetyltransferase